MVLHHIFNYNTEKVLYETIRRSTSTMKKNHWYKEHADIDDRIYTLLGSVRGETMMHILLDYKTEIGYSSVDRVVLFGCP